MHELVDHAGSVARELVARYGLAKGETTMATIVLVHGAYQGGWIWRHVTARLTAGDHCVYAPSLDGCAERRHALRPGINTETHGAEIADLLFFEDLHDV